jgi:hypothetical protein
VVEAEPTATDEVRAAEVIASMCLATDLGMGFHFEHGLHHATLTTMRLCEILDVANVVWCTGFEPGFSWIDLPVFDDDGHVAHERGVVEVVPGLYFVGLKFQYTLLSDTLHAAGRDSGYVVDHLLEERRTSPSTERASL